MQIKVGIIGYGFMGHEHAKMFADMDEIYVTAVCDVDEEQLKDVPEGIEVYRDAKKLLQNADVDTVIISVPNTLHYEMVKLAAEAGKFIICEKPAAMTVAEFDEMVKVVKTAGVHMTIHQQRRWDVDYCTMKAVYEKRLVGKPYIIKSQLYGFNGNMHDWHVYPELGGGMLYDWGVHLIDQIFQMVDSRLVSVYADMKNVINKNVDDYFKILFEYENGVTAEIELGTYYLIPKRSWFIGGTTGSAVIDGPFKAQGNAEGKIVRTTHLLESTPGKLTMTSAGPTRSFGEPEPGLLYEEKLPGIYTEHKDYFRNYLNARAGLEDYAVKLEEVRRVLVLMDMVRESAATHHAVAVKKDFYEE
ncbi:MAG: Gfo/Idh/MocA family protein [Lachnospiraceae bacterium]